MKFSEATGFSAVASARSLFDGRPVLNKLSKRQRSSLRNLRVSAIGKFTPQVAGEDDADDVLTVSESGGTAGRPPVACGFP